MYREGDSGPAGIPGPPGFVGPFPFFKLACWRLWKRMVCRVKGHDGIRTTAMPFSNPTYLCVRCQRRVKPVGSWVAMTKGEMVAEVMMRDDASQSVCDTVTMQGPTGYQGTPGPMGWAGPVGNVVSGTAGTLPGNVTYTVNGVAHGGSYGGSP